MEKPTEEKKYQELANKWLSGEITEDEKALLFNYYAITDSDSEEIEIPARFDGNEDSYKDYLYQKIKKRINPKKTAALKLWLWSSAAAIFVIIGFVLINPVSNTQEKIVSRTIKQKGSSQQVKFSDPILVLDDGSKVSLSKNRLSALVSEKGLDISQDNDGKLVYTVKNNNEKVLFNELKTPVGQQLIIYLSDGTKVYLNAGSSLRFPTVFNTSKREVHLSGEAYFEVAKNREKPFKVYTSNQEIEVLGTHFNVNAYENELSVLTTLVEGKVKVKSKSTSGFAILEPGQQSALQSGKLAISEADISAAVAWRSGYFKFTNEDLESIMRKLQRWYDIEVVYETENNPNLTFDGQISQTKSISSILKIIEEAGNVHFKVSGRRITVLR